MKRWMVQTLLESLCPSTHVFRNWPGPVPAVRPRAACSRLQHAVRGWATVSPMHACAGPYCSPTPPGCLPAAQAPSRAQVSWLRCTRTPIRRITFLPSCMPCRSTLSTAPAQLARRAAGTCPALCLFRRCVPAQALLHAPAGAIGGVEM